MHCTICAPVASPSKYAPCKYPAANLHQHPPLTEISNKNSPPKYFSLVASPENQRRPTGARKLVTCCGTKLAGQLLKLPRYSGSFNHRGKRNAVGAGITTFGNIARSTSITSDCTSASGRASTRFE